MLSISMLNSSAIFYLGFLRKVAGRIFLLKKMGFECLHEGTMQTSAF